MTICPECEQGKHGNCTGWALDETDREVECMCQVCDRLKAGTPRVPTASELDEALRIYGMPATINGVPGGTIAFIPTTPRTCRVCHCTDTNACLPPAGPCHWVEADLCSACKPPCEEVSDARPGHERG